MANTANATGQKTPPPTFPPEIKSTPNAVGTAVVSENISAVGTNVDNVRPWINRDVQDYRKCTLDEMLQELLYRCGEEFEFDSEGDPEEKETLLKDALNTVLSICDESMKKAMQTHLSAFVDCSTEPPSHKPFVQAVNFALRKLNKLKVRGVPDANDDDDSSIIFHHNDVPIKQKHQDVESERKPDVVVVSYASARGVLEEGKKPPSKHQVYSDLACEKPHGRFLWTDVLSTFEFKRSAKHKMKQPNYDKVVIADAPTPHHMELGNRRGKAVQPTSSTPVPAAGPSQGASNETRRVTRSSKKRTSENLGSSEPTSKRVKSNNEDLYNERLSKKTDPLEQNGMYAAEMFAAHVARQCVISCVVDNDVIYIWYFDRQDAIQCSGFNFIHDLPRFLVFLLIMQRMQYAQWGHNPLFEPEPASSATAKVPDEKLGTVDLEFDFSSSERTTHYGLRGRATNVFPVKSVRLSREARQRPSRNKTDELVAKIYWPEQSRQSEAEILEEVHKIAAENPEVKDHVPDVIWSHKFEGTSTAKIREALGIDNAQVGSRVLYIIVFRKLRPITELSGHKFLRAWWHAVECHRILWAKGVRHRDISPSNLMFYLDSNDEVVGVLNDYDLSSLKNVPSGWERTGTVPFMAMELLTPKALAGKVEHLYRHDAESFIWVLTWVSFRYDNGKLLREGRLLDEWLTKTAIECYKEKSSFLNLERLDDNLEVASSHQSNWNIARSCLHHVASHTSAYPRLMPDDNQVYREWLQAQVLPWL